MLTYPNSALGFIHTHYYLPRGGYYDDLQKVGLVYMDRTDPAQAGDSWRALVNAVMDLRIP